MLSDQVGSALMMQIMPLSKLHCLKFSHPRRAACLTMKSALMRQLVIHVKLLASFCVIVDGTPGLATSGDFPCYDINGTFH